ncbi:MAG: hypothetical protein B6U86_03555 [Candidatus Altiarchaeales archaeon ex4484_43]|nr:MAG: hypothetical protein B6U86_03555 [Candidatus Altiarchaeales archaeon ex4484_43]
MDFLITFLNQVVVLFLMLIGMFVGDSVAGSIFGNIKGRVRQFLYLLLFVIFLVFGNYIPSLIGIYPLGLLNSILLFSIWGFLSVFLSRFLLFLIDLSIYFGKKLRTKKQPQAIVAIEKLIRYLQDRGMGAEGIKFILSVSLGSEKKAEDIQNRVKNGKLNKGIAIDPYRLSSAFRQSDFDANEILEILVKFLGLTPEKAVRIWRRST